MVKSFDTKQYCVLNTNHETLECLICEEVEAPFGVGVRVGPFNVLQTAMERFKTQHEFCLNGLVREKFTDLRQCME